MSEQLFFGSLALALAYGVYNRDQAVLMSCVGIGILYTLLDQEKVIRLLENNNNLEASTAAAPPPPDGEVNTQEAPVEPPLLPSDKVARLLDERIRMGQVSKFATAKQKEAYEKYRLDVDHQLSPPPKGGGTYLQMFSF
jgi:hypothetical protein